MRPINVTNMSAFDYLELARRANAFIEHAIESKPPNLALVKDVLAAQIKSLDEAERLISAKITAFDALPDVAKDAVDHMMHEAVPLIEPPLGDDMSEKPHRHSGPEGRDNVVHGIFDPARRDKPHQP